MRTPTTLAQCFQQLLALFGLSVLVIGYVLGGIWAYRHNEYMLFGLGYEIPMGMLASSALGLFLLWSFEVLGIW